MQFNCASEASFHNLSSSPHKEQLRICDDRQATGVRILQSYRQFTTKGTKIYAFV